MTRSRGRKSTPPLLLLLPPHSTFRRVLSPCRAPLSLPLMLSSTILLGNGTYWREHSDAKRAASLCRKRIFFYGFTSARSPPPSLSLFPVRDSLLAFARRFPRGDFREDRNVKQKPRRFLISRDYKCVFLHGGNIARFLALSSPFSKDIPFSFIIRSLVAQKYCHGVIVHPSLET